MPCYPCPIPKDGVDFPHHWSCDADPVEAARKLAEHLTEGHWNANPTVASDDVDANEKKEYLERFKTSLTTNA